MFATVIDALLKNNLDEARRGIDNYLAEYGKWLLDADGEFTEVGLLDTLDYKLPKELCKLMVKALSDKSYLYELKNEYPDHVRVFQLEANPSGELSNYFLTKAIHSLPLEKQCSILEN